LEDLSAKLIDRLTIKISKGGQWSIFIFRLTPFTRGYASVISGLLPIGPGVFMPLAFISGLSWASIYIITGYYIGPSWNIFSKHIVSFKYIMITVLIIILSTLLLVFFVKKRKNHKISTCIGNC
jgi:membrane protein DedA with SNARE-associated domain